MRSAEELEAAFAAAADEAPGLGSGPLRVGQDFGTRYTVLKLLGAGGMGVVYQALDRDLGVPVALKVLRLPSGNPHAQADLARRLKTELLLARKVTHKHVIRIHDIGEIDGIRFITMPFVDGHDLATLLKKGPISITQAVRYARQLAAGLSAAHAAGVIHRDLKPANIMVGDDDQALLMDFGIARSSAPGAAHRTVAGAVVGTAAYMAPEQARGESVDGRADIYAFGLILYEMLCGPRFMAKGAVADLFARMTVAPSPARAANAQVPEALDAIVTRCVQPHAGDRYQTAAELAAALAALSRRGAGPVPGAPPPSQRWLIKAGAVAAAVLLAVLAYLFAPAIDVSALGRGGAGSKAAAGASGAADDAVTATAAAVAALQERVEALERAPNDAGVRTGVAVLSLRTGDFAGAARHAERVVREHPRAVDAYVPLATATALTAPERAAAPYEQLATIVPDGPPLAAAGRADLALFQHRPTDAVAILEPVLTNAAHMKGPVAANQYLTLAEAQVDLGRPEEALASVDRALDSSRTDGVLLPAARLFLDLEHEPEAAAIARELQARATQEARAYATIVTAEIALRHGDAAAAIASLETLVAEQDLWLARFVLGTAYMQAGRFEEAAAEFETCQLRRGEAAMLFEDDLPTLRYLADLEPWLERARSR